MIVKPVLKLYKIGGCSLSARYCPLHLSSIKEAPSMHACNNTIKLEMLLLGLDRVEFESTLIRKLGSYIRHAQKILRPGIHMTQDYLIKIFTS